MADTGKSKSIDSDKAALGRKLLNKHQKSKTSRSNTNDKQNIENFEGQANANSSLNNYANNFTNAEPTLTSGSVTPELDCKQLESMPIQQYFNMSNNNNFFDFDQVTIDDPEIKHNEIFNLHHQNISELSEIIPTQYPQELVGTFEQRSSNREETAPQFSSVPASESPKTIVITPNHHTDADLMQQQLAIDSLQSQLQQQVLANSHLLGENAQLQGELNHSRSIIAKHKDQVREFNLRIESAESRLGESQRQLDKSRHLTEEWRVKAEQDEYTVNSVRKERDIALQDASEVLERLGLAQAEDARTKDVLGQLRAQLDMANIRVQQLVTTAGIQSIAACEEASHAGQTESLLLEKQLADVQVTLEATRTERDVAAQQYQLYNSQLSEQLVTLQGELQTLHATTDHLANRERDLVAHIGDMERLLQNNNNSSTQLPSGGAALVASSASGDSEDKVLDQLTERLQVACTERDEALKELHKLAGEVEELNELRNSQQVDSLAQVKLLEEIRSDKVAASRAIEQNLVLKAQVTEMEAAYLAVTQDKVAPLTDQLATAKHQLHQFERNLRTLHDAVEMKDRELEQMRVCETQVAHLTDRLRHYEAIHEHGAPSIQLQLQNLQHENDRLRRKQLEQQQHNHLRTPHDVCDDNDVEDEHEHGDDEALCSDHHHHHHHGEDTDNVVVGGVDREDELQQEIFQLKQELDELRRLNAELVSMQPEQDENDAGDDNIVTKRLSKAKAAEQLEHKFTRTMDELASLNDEKQRLEHLVLQLQGETETIGEYVALYQRQRSLLAQRSAAREAQLRHLQERLGDLAAALESPAATGADQNSVAQLLHEIRKSNADLMVEQREQDPQQQQQQHGDGGECGVGACAWCQGKLITV